LLHRIATGYPFTSLFTATQTEVSRRRQPSGQNREGPVAWLAESTPNPKAFLPVIVRLAEPPTVADDCLVLANRTPPWQEGQWDHPGSLLSFVSGSAIKRITAGVKAPPRPSTVKVSICWLGLHPPAKVSFKRKRILLSVSVEGCDPFPPPLAGIKGLLTNHDPSFAFER
jgi:hypothetical protein